MAADHVQHLGWPDWEERGPRARRRHLPHPRRRPSARSSSTRPSATSGRLRPWRGRARRRRQPERMARRGGVPRVHAPGGRAPDAQLFDRRSPSSCGRETAPLRGQAATRPGCASASTSSTEELHGDRLGADARVRVRDVRQRRGQRPRPRGAGTVEPGERVRARPRRDRGTSRRAPGPEATRSSPRSTGARTLFGGRRLEKVPDLLVEFTEYAWLARGTLKKRGETIWDAIEIEPGSEHSMSAATGTKASSCSQAHQLAVEGPARSPNRGRRADRSLPHGRADSRRPGR